MDVTFLIGNGFDLNLGLNTRYKDFLRYYTHPKRKKTELIESFVGDILQDAPLWSNAEWAFGEYTEKFDGTKLTVDDYCDCHEDFCVQLGKYLGEEQKRLEPSKAEIEGKFAAAISNVTKGFREQSISDINVAISKISGGFNYNFLSFNYTECLDSFVDLTRDTKALGNRTFGSITYTNSLGKLIHVHGYTHRDMVLGLNDLSQIRNTALFENKDEGYLDQIIKRQTNLINEEQIDQKANAILSSSDVIYVYGMSIGATDAIWWERICNALRQRGNNILIVHAFDAPDDGLIRRKYLIFERARKNEILKYSKLSPEENEKIAKRIYITGADIFSEFRGLAKPHDSVSALIGNHTEDSVTVE